MATESGESLASGTLHKHDDTKVSAGTHIRSQTPQFREVCRNAQLYVHHYRAIQTIAARTPYAQRLRSYKEATRPRGHFRADGIHGAKIDSQQAAWVVEVVRRYGIRQRPQNKNAKRELDWQALSLVVSQLARAGLNLPDSDDQKNRYSPILKGR